MAIEVAVQRLEIGDVVLVSLPDQEEKVEATVARDIDRTAHVSRPCASRYEWKDERTSSRSGRSARWSPSCAVPDGDDALESSESPMRAPMPTDIRPATRADVAAITVGATGSFQLRLNPDGSSTGKVIGHGAWLSNPVTGQPGIWYQSGAR